VAGIALHAMEPSRMNGYHSALHVDQVVFTQTALPFM
jgi:hypothetical protein